GVNFEAAEDTLRGRLTKLDKKIDVLRKKKQKQSDFTVSNDLSRTEVSKFLVLEKQIRETNSQLQDLLNCMVTQED
ncbi:hypothetical protein ACTXT7_016883, partial [Hymenolepis weldensis]